MAALQPELTSPAMIPLNCPLIVIDLKVCFFTLPLHSDDVPGFAFSVTTLNHAEPMKRYHWTVFPQGMCNSPTTGQRVVDLTLKPVCHQFPEATISHYMDDILLAAGDHCVLYRWLIQAIQAAGSVIAPEKKQQQALWHYLG